MAKMTINIPDEEYKELKIRAIKHGESVKDYVLKSLSLRKKLVMNEEENILNDKTIKTLQESRKNKKLKSFKSAKQLMDYLLSSDK